MTTDTITVTTPSDRQVQVTRLFNAPRHLVYKALTTPELVKRWLHGPDGWTLDVCEIDLRVGGAYRYVWRKPDGRGMGMGGVYRELVPPERIVHTELFDDDWTGGETEVTTALVEVARVTTLTATVLFVSQAARDAAMSTGFTRGMASAYDTLDELLSAEGERVAMSAVAALGEEFGKEARTTRRLLERVPADRLAWRPHPKSFTAAGLTSHIVECVGWAESIFTRDELDFDPITFVPYEAASVPELLTTFDAKVARGLAALSAADDVALARPWRLKLLGTTRMERPKAAAFRDFTLSHLIHHRGQLSVYLRLLDVPVPGSYGPTADERG